MVAEVGDSRRATPSAVVRVHEFYGTNLNNMIHDNFCCMSVIVLSVPQVSDRFVSRTENLGSMRVASLPSVQAARRGAAGFDTFCRLHRRALSDWMTVSLEHWH